MNKDEISVKSSEVAEIQMVQDECEITLKTPYYWSWYRCAFPPHGGRAAEEQGIAVKEKK